MEGQPLLFDQLFFQFLLALLVVYPLWRIHARAGLNRLLSLFVFVPFFGGLIVLAILAFSHWPAVEGEGGAPEAGS